MSEYIKKTWKDGEVITAEALNNIEAGIAEAKKENEAHGQNKKNPHGVTPAQIGAVPTTRTVNGKTLDKDVNLTPDDIEALSNSGGTIAGDLTVHRKAETSLMTIKSDSGQTARLAFNSNDEVVGEWYASGYGNLVFKDRTNNISVFEYNVSERRFNQVNGAYSSGTVTVIEKVSITNYTLQKNIFANVCFFQLYIKSTEALSAGTAISVVKVSDDFVPSRIQALSCYAPTGSIDACINSSGNIRLRPSSDIKTDAYIYVQGFWFL